ncbi:hypothetical protein WA026_023025 [Henosepilachna vigintioctopunctata]|uniref:Uncharacterized protein n=1 Tax=Henosepilachna vigintioctopunctata TaxID=420089 RepID=A0AAW1VIR7_9CUCU
MNRITEPPDKGGGEPSSSVITEAFRVLLNEEIMDIPESQNAQLPNDKVVHRVSSFQNVNNTSPSVQVIHSENSNLLQQGNANEVNNAPPKKYRTDSHVSPPAKSHSNDPPLKSVKRKYFVDYAAIDLKRKHSEIRRSPVLRLLATVVV